MKHTNTKLIVGSADDVEFVIQELTDFNFKKNTPADSIIMHEPYKVYYTQNQFERLASRLQKRKDVRIHKFCAIAIANQIQKTLLEGCNGLNVILFNGSDKTTTSLTF
jgi:hypothetical protein